MKEKFLLLRILQYTKFTGLDKKNLLGDFFICKLISLPIVQLLEYPPTYMLFFISNRNFENRLEYAYLGILLFFF